MKKRTKKDDQKILQKLKMFLEDCVSTYSIQYSEMREDLRFKSGYQWDTSASRERRNRPKLTYNLAEKYIDKTVNNIRKNPFSISVSLDESEDQEFLQDLVRGIENACNANESYEQAFENAVTCGRGWIHLVVDDTAGQAEIKIEKILMPDTVYISTLSKSTDGSDADEGIIVRYISERTATQRHGEDAGRQNNSQFEALYKGWTVPENTVPEILYYERNHIRKRIVEINGERFENPTDEEIGFQLSDFQLSENPGAFSESEVVETYVMCYKVVGCVVVDEMKIPIDFIPIVPNYGVVEYRGDNTIGYKGKIKKIKDPQRVYNWEVSTEIEALASAPRAQWMMAEGQDEGYEKMWQGSNVNKEAVLRYRPVSFGGATLSPPQRIDNMAQIGHIIEARRQTQADIASIMGMPDAMFGAETGVERSGKAVLLRRQEAETNDAHYLDNHKETVKQAGRIILQLIDWIYDSGRKLRLKDADGNMYTEERDVSDMNLREAEVSVFAGPSYETTKMESADKLMELARIFPEPMAQTLDKLVGTLEMPGAAEIAQRVAQALGVATEEGQLTPEAQRIIDEATKTQQELQILVDTQENWIQQLQTKIIDDEKDRQVKIAIEEIKARTDIAVAEINATARITQEDMKQSGEDSRSAAKILAEAEADIREIVERRVKESEEVVETIRGRVNMLPPAPGPVNPGVAQGINTTPTRGTA